MRDHQMSKLYEARRRALEAEAEVLDVDDEAVALDRLVSALEEGRKEPKPEASFRFQVVADLLGKLASRGSTEVLVGLLGEDEAAVRAVVVESLERLVRAGRGAEVAWAVERALERGLPGPGASQLPALLMSVGDDGPPLDLLMRLLEHDDAEAAAEAACALSSVGGPGVRELLSSFVDDGRALIADAGEPETVGALVKDLLEVMDLDRSFPPPGQGTPRA